MTILKNALGPVALFSAAFAPVTPVLAQDATVSKEDLETAYALTMMCLEATTSMAIKAEAAGDKETYDKLANDGVVWLGVADSFGKELGRTAADDFDSSVGRIVAEGNLLGDDAAAARQKQVYDACQLFLAPAAQ